MEKGMMEGSSENPNLVPPTAPPSYDEAIANAGAVSRPYPLPDSSQYLPQSTPMPMPNPYGQPTAAMPMPMPTSNAQPQVHQYQPGSQYPQGPHMAPHAYAAPQIQVIQQAVTYALGPNSIKMTCPSCRADIKTTTVSDHQASAHICCIILCLLGCCLCSCLPYCMNAFMSVHHSCPNCKAYIGTWKG